MFGYLDLYRRRLESAASCFLATFTLSGFTALVAAQLFINICFLNFFKDFFVKIVSGSLKAP